MTIEVCKICSGRMIDRHCPYCGARKVTVNGMGTAYYNDRLIPMGRGLRLTIPTEVTEIFRTAHARKEGRA